MKRGKFITKDKIGIYLGPFVYIDRKHGRWFYKTPLWLRKILFVFICPYYK